MTKTKYRRTNLLNLLEHAGFHYIEPPLLLRADLVVDLAGEALGRQLFMTSDAEGRELCLRPDFTISVVESHLAGEANGGAYSYCGTVFRQSAAKGEMEQAGIELLGRSDLVKADAEVTILGFEGAKLYCNQSFDMVLGDIGIFRAVVAALDLSSAWRRKLLKDFHRAKSLDNDMARLAKGESATNSFKGLTSVLKMAEPEAARMLIDDVLQLAGIEHVGGRSASEIAERLAEQASLASSQLDPDKARLVADVLQVNDKPRSALASIDSLTKAQGVDISSALSALAERLDFLEKGGVNMEKITFSTRFGRSVDYYTGHVFEIRAAGDGSSPPLVGGGRYDHLTDAMANRLGLERGTPAVGCAFFLDRLNVVGGAS